MRVGGPRTGDIVGGVRVMEADIDVDVGVCTIERLCVLSFGVWGVPTSIG